MATLLTQQPTEPSALRVPPNALRYILFQRSAYLRLLQYRAYRLLEKVLPLPLRNHLIRFESNWRQEEILSLYRADMSQEFESFRAFLPRDCSSVLDIGCGVAGIDVHIWRHYQPSPPHIYLLDKTQVDDNVYYGFKQKASFYNSLDVACDLLHENGIPRSRVTALEADDTGNIPIDAKLDLVISLISWGFHYPVGVYAEAVRNAIADDGIVILDVRKQSDGLQELQKHFTSCRVVFEGLRHERVVCTK